MTLPSGTITFLFTDIEGSTRLAQEHPGTWETTRARHHDILRGSIDSENGYVFQIIGDAFCATFHKAGDALKSAIKAQRGLQTETWGDVPIGVRMGIHTGEAEIQSDGQYHSYLALSLVQRVMSAGHGGQVLLSNATENLLRGQLPKDITLQDMGEHKLKDVPQSVRIFQVVAPDLQSEFPALHTLSVFPNNLPAQLTSFVGREKELADVKKLLRDAHMLTLIGPGGTGKTRLSIQAANDVLNQYPDGVWMVDLAPILDPLLVPRTTAITIGLRNEPQRPVIDMLCDYLAKKKMLLILDNCEHLVDACAQMSNRILHAAPDVRILASSREALGIAGEVTYRVPSLGLPDVDNLPSLETLSQYEAVKLFIDRATAAIPDFKVTNENAPALAQICHRLDGIPLALEFAAAKIRVLGVEQIANRLDDRFKLLTGGSRTAMERHQTLRATVDWSYNLLPLEEQTLFRQLAVFRGGWTLEAAEAICGDNVLDLMEQLINKSLVITEDEAGTSRYHMLETIRQYANEKLGEENSIHEQHFVYFLNLAETIEAYLEKPEQRNWLDKLESEHNNFRAALRWAREKKQVERGIRLASALSLFWFMRGYLSEGLAQIGEFLAQSERIVNATMRVKALDRAGMLARYQGDLNTSYELIAESLALRRELGDRHGVADSLSNLGFVVLHQNDFSQARQLYSEALSINRELDNQQGIADSLSHLALMAFYEGDYESAQAMDESSLVIWRAVGDQQGVAWAIHRLGNVKLHQGEYSVACDHFKESLAISNDLGFKLGIAFAAEGLASVAAGTGDATQAILIAGGAFALRQTTGIPLSSVAQADFERMLAPARKLLGEEIAGQIWAKGLGLKIEQLVTKAREVK